MPAALSARLLERIPEASGLYHRLVLGVGPARSGKTEGKDVSKVRVVLE